METEWIANELLAPLWRGIAPEYKRKYSLSIWQQFEDQIRSAAYTASISKFLEAIKRKLGLEIEKADVERVLGFLRECDERDTLKALRDETALLVLYVRVANEERKAARAGADTNSASAA